MTDEEKLDKIFEEALNEFDFERVRKVMKHLNWCWVGDTEPPNYPEMIKVVRTLYSHAKKDTSIDNVATTVASGGFHVKVYPGEDCGVEIKFVVAQSEYYTEDDE